MDDRMLSVAVKRRQSGRWIPPRHLPAADRFRAAAIFFLYSAKRQSPLSGGKCAARSFAYGPSQSRSLYYSSSPLASSSSHFYVGLATPDNRISSGCSYPYLNAPSPQEI